MSDQPEMVEAAWEAVAKYHGCRLKVCKDANENDCDCATEARRVLAAALASRSPAPAPLLLSEAVRAMCHVSPCECADTSGYDDYETCRLVYRHANALLDYLKSRPTTPAGAEIVEECARYKAALEEIAHEWTDLGRMQGIARRSLATQARQKEEGE